MHDLGMAREAISLERARELLATIGPSYRFRTHHFERICRDMRHGDFQSLESIPLVVEVTDSGTERLHNGRHRLAAQLREQREFEYYVHYMTPEAARRWDIVGDNAASWTLADHLRLEGVKNAVAVGSALTYLHRFRSGTMIARSQPTRAEALKLLDANSALPDYLAVTGMAARGFKISGGMCAATAYLTSVSEGVDADDISDFWSSLEGLASMELEEVAAAVSETSGPILTYANWLRRTMPARNRAYRRSETLTWAYLVKSWNAYITSSTWERPRFGPKEKFPGLASSSGALLIPGSKDVINLTGGEGI